ncbi:MAG TPA: carboxypeptidase regulatory-like domain-containing protein [Bryobacteraceae bacterium]|nr:carboxypeptidase regulatory-like domain-containing protein [Bryobacteraceae bacterium]
MAKIGIFLILWAAAGIAQDQPPTDGPAPGSIAGRVTDAGTGSPMPEVDVYANRGARDELHAVTDAQGRYAIRGLEAGQYRVSAMAPSPVGHGFGASASRQVSLAAGQELAAIDFHLVAFASVTGRVVDQNNEPVPGLTVFLVAREYSGGVLRAVFARSSLTDDRGDYRLERIPAGRGYFILAQRFPRDLDAISNAPLDPKLRRPAVVPTYYPNGANMDNGQALVLAPGEHREGVDIHLVRSPSLCVEAVLEGASGPSDLHFNIAETQPASGASGDGAFYMRMPHGVSGRDGKVRICDLHPGQYELSATEYGAEPQSPASMFGAVVLNIADQDLRGVRLVTRPRLVLPGEVVWDGAAPVNPPAAEVNIRVQPITRTGDAALFAGVNVPLPGEFSLPGVLMDEYLVRITRVPTGMYIKDVTYGGHSIWNLTLRPGTATADPSLRVVVARDGGTLTARVTDKDGNPVGDTTVVAMPAAADSEAILAATMLTGKTDQFGAYTSSTLAPGKYYVLAPMTAVDKSPESIARLWRARTAAYEVEVPPNGTGAAMLVPKAIE